MMSGKLYMIQANMRKFRETTHSFFHDPDSEQASLLLFTEPYAKLDVKSHPVSVVLFHTTWQAFYPSQVGHPTANRAASKSISLFDLGSKRSKKFNEFPFFIWILRLFYFLH